MNKKTISALISIPLIVVINVSPAYANAGTPIIWLLPIHLLIGNAVIGCIEALIISKLYKTKLLITALWMIIANYISCGVGFWLNAEYLFNDVSIFNATRLILTAIITLIFLTTVVEWPFCYIVLRKKKNRLK